jgi:predicted ATPase
MTTSCTCSDLPAVASLIVVTGGPGAGKTALLEVARRMFCEHVVILPEAAGILFQGGFPRRTSAAAHRAAQRAIFRVQQELERLTREEGRAMVGLCDRGTIDCLAYWDAEPAAFWADLGTSHHDEIGHYDAVIHLRTPGDGHGYDRSNPLRLENADEAAYRDGRILDAWAPHPARTVIASEASFFDKLSTALAALRPFIPASCILAPALQLQQP